jgi:hypothetical protein
MPGVAPVKETVVASVVECRMCSHVASGNVTALPLDVTACGMSTTRPLPEPLTLMGLDVSVEPASL